ncbi:DUF3450 domain-containing protein [Pistricoccus aurantiacus]|uniref:DUF3450 domain-containing protein n=1 Tax=Pistricoccus aurantiacus TaxID=1883414 RepID=UPI001FEBA4D5|nr:DUF3450 domain-containing protein [Pistricoccus aurantiacus]
MSCPPTLTRLGFVLLLCWLSTLAIADTTRTQEASKAQAELQARIEAADDETRRKLQALRDTRTNIQRLEAYNAELIPLLERQARELDQQEEALNSLTRTREALPVLMRSLVERLERWIESDMPFLRKERLARAASLETLLSDPQVSPSDKLERILNAWRAELDYGREVDTWRGQLEDGDQARDVEFLRVGRVGWYYLTPNGHAGGVWKNASREWVFLAEGELKSLRNGLRIARDQRAPELLILPASLSIKDQAPTSSPAEESRS